VKNPKPETYKNKVLPFIYNNCVNLTTLYDKLSEGSDIEKKSFWGVNY